MKLAIALMLASILGVVLANSFTSAVRDFAKPEKAACKVGRLL